jgi:hypothetical protein
MENNEKPSLDSLGEPWAKLSRELTYLEILNDVKNLLNSIPTKIFFTYKEDETEKGLYHIYFNDVLCTKAKVNKMEDIETLIKTLEFGALRGCAYTLESLVDSMHDKLVPKKHE